MLFLRLPGYISRLGNGSLASAAAALQSIGAGSCADTAPHCGSAQPLLRLSTFNSSAFTAAPNATKDASNGSSATSSTLNISRGLATLASPESAAAEIFDRDLKRVHRDRAARLQAPDDPLLEAIAEGLVDRLADCKRSFPTAAVINGAGENVVRRLAGGRSGIEEVLLLDTSQKMLRRAQRLKAEHRQAEPGAVLPKMRYIQADEECLPLQQHSVDVIICPLGLHWINDLPGALMQCRRALKPDGLFLGALLGGESLQVRDAGNLLTRAGLAIPAVDVDEIIMRYTDPARLVAHVRAMGEQNAVRKARRNVRRETALLTAAKYREMFGKPDSIPATFQVIYLTGWAPHSSQQRAARRGSASASFQDLDKEIGKAGGQN